ncbi:hypothetical protein PV04_00240 [Phialophora macrospora]|uniref:RING-type domain-containing protein n=1 Tax=Phialophora macrospora TaxID=1851006 RepID=A0A0D2D3H4_9EURO|nr:hypothetical protein PV04_00240 [Phialophora macrospora]
MAAPDLLATFQKHIEDMRNLSLCKICIKPFYEPFILPCGHTYCYSCLASWFGGGTGRRSKSTCPDCRANVRVEPSPNYLLRDLVHMFIGRAELLPEDETVQEHQTAKDEEAVLLAADRAGPGLFKGAFLGLGHARVARNWRGGILDPEDNVWRCPNCHWELEHGGCSQCGFHQIDLSGSDSDSDMDESIDLDDSEMDDEIEIDHEFGTTMGEHGFHFHYPDTSTHRRSISSDDDDDDEDDDDDDDQDEDNDMDGFIDNEVEDGDTDSDADTESTMTIYNRQLRNNHGANSRPFLSDEVFNDRLLPEHMYDPDYPQDESGPRSTIDTARSTNGDQSDAATNYDDMTEASDIETMPVQPARRSGVMRVIISSDDEDEDGPEVNLSVTAEHSTEIGHDDHEDENEDERENHDLASEVSMTEHSHNDSDSDSDNDEESDSDSKDSDDSIRPPQSSNRRRQHLNNQRARRSNGIPIGGYAAMRPTRPRRSDDSPIGGHAAMRPSRARSSNGIPIGGYAAMRPTRPRRSDDNPIGGSAPRSSTRASTGTDTVGRYALRRAAHAPTGSDTAVDGYAPRSPTGAPTVNDTVVGGYEPMNPSRQPHPQQQSHRGRGNVNRYQPSQRLLGRRIPVGGGN